MTRFFLATALSIAVIGCSGCSTEPEDNSDVEELFSGGQALTAEVIAERNTYCIDNPDYSGCEAWCQSPDADCDNGTQVEVTADFQHMRTSGRTVSFSNQSENAQYYLWNFGDGSQSGVENPTHTFGTDGEFNVSLTATGNGTTDTRTKQVTVSQTQPNPPTASFTYTANELTVAFSNSSINATSSSWDFGDGNASSDTSPNHTYATAGTYDVTLTASNVDGSDMATQSVTVTDPTSVLPVASFTYSVTDLSVAFTNASQNATSSAWDFGDGNASTESSPAHTYATAGTYDVTLTASNVDGSDMATQSVTVTDPTSVLPVASFTYSVTDLSVAFTNASQNATSSAWDFGDGNASTESSPAHTYTTAGTYDVTLTASNVDGSDMATQSVTVTNPPLVLPVASFSYSANELAVSFTNTSTDATSSAWDFGDGNASTESSPAHTYTTAGTYDVTLTASNVDGSDMATQSVTVTNPPLVLPVASFSYSANELAVSFTNTSTDATSSAWDFGDGNASTESSPAHTYTTAGTYDVTLTASNVDGSDMATQSVTVTNPPLVLPVASFSYSANELVVSFTNTSTDATSSAWDFGDGNASTESSPAHTYTTAGTYDVTLTASNVDGSDMATQGVTVSNDIPPPPSDGSIWMAGHSYMRGIDTMIDLGADLGEYRGGEGNLATWLERTDLAILPARDYEHAGFIEWLQRQDQVDGSASAAAEIEALVGYDVSIMIQWFQTEPACNTHGLICGPGGQALFNDLYGQMAAQAGVDLIPVGDAFVNAYNAGVTSLHSDGSHASTQGEYLRNVTLYSYFSGIDARSLPDLGVASAGVLKQAAYDALQN